MTVERINERIRERGHTQSRIARALGISQGHLSKVLRGNVPASPTLLRQMDALLEGEAGSDEFASLGAEVVRAARRSPDFHALVTRALKLMHHDA